MTVYVQFGIFFLQLIFAAAELIAGVLLAREALRRRGQKHLSLFSIYLVLVGTGALMSFLGGFFDSQGFREIGSVLSSLFVVFVVVGSYFFGLAIVNLYANRRSRRLLNIILLVTAVIALLVGERAMIQAFGVHIGVGGAESFVVSYAYWILMNLFAIPFALVSCRKSRLESGFTCRADQLIVIGSLLQVLAALLTALFLKTDVLSGAMLVYAVLTLSVIYKYLGTNAKGHPDADIARHPQNVIKATLMGKVLLVSALFFALMTSMLLASISDFFVERSLADQASRTRAALSYSADKIQDLHDSAMFDAMMLSQYGFGLRVLSGDVEAMGKMGESVGFRDDDRWLDIVDSRGDIVASSLGRVGEGQSLSDSMAVISALDGKSDAVTEWDSSIGTWVVRAASVITDSSGAARGAVVVSQPMLELPLSICEGGQAMPMSGCGYVSASGEIIISSGAVPDALTFESFRSSINAQTGFGGGETEDLFGFSVKDVKDTLGEYDGFVFVTVTRQDYENEQFRILSAVVVVMTLFLVIASILLAFGMALVLRPLKMLKVVADRVSGGDYGISVDYESPDEMGRLAAAFNHMSRTIRDRTKSLNERVREQRDFLSHTAHEIRTPLNIFRWSLEMLRFGDTGQLNKEQMELVEQMHQTNERIRIMVDELLAVSRMDRGGIKMSREPIAIEDVIDEVAGAYSVKIREKTIDFYWRHPDEPIAKVFADKKRLYEVITNLIGNAVKFTGKEGHIFVTVSESDVSGPGGRDGRFIHVQVEDNGRGIPEDQHKFVFKRFFRARNVLGEEIEGTGLGLYISKNFVEMHGGEIWFESEESAGSTFHFTIPVAEEEK